MRTIALLVFLLIASSAYAQSKKDLQLQVTQLKSEIDELKKPKKIEVDLNNPNKKASYALGVLMANGVRKQGGDSLDLDAITVGMSEVFHKTETKLDEKQCTMVVQQYMQQSMERRATKVKTESVAFLETNKTKPGVVTTASGLQYQILTKGSGKIPTTSSNVTVHYTGKLVDGTVFDTSVGGEPATFGVTQVIAGWTEVLQLMKEGDKWLVFVPSDLGYGDRGAGAEIPPSAALIFEIELLKVN